MEPEALIMIITFVLIAAPAVALGLYAASSIRRSKYIKKGVELSNEKDMAESLEKYKALLDKGAITQEEFDDKKKQLLGL